MTTATLCRCGRPLYDFRLYFADRNKRLCKGCQRLSRYCECTGARSP